MIVPATTMSDWSAEIIGLKAAIASGVTRASYGGQSVDYADLDSMKQRLNLLTLWQAQLTNPGYRRPQSGFATFRRPGTTYSC